MSEDFITFVDDAPVVAGVVPNAWKILVVDDDQDVHTVTELVMHGVSILGRPLKFLHAFRASEAIDILSRDHDIAVILLDVVMEIENAGFKLVKHVREVMKLDSIRIILRTGQPGYAPEYEAIRDYDINDYRTKSELSYARFLTSLTSALRSYTQIIRITKSSENLSYVIKSVPQILACETLTDFVLSMDNLFKGIINDQYSLCILNQVRELGSQRYIPGLMSVLFGTGQWTQSRAVQIDFSGTSEIPGFSYALQDLIRQAYETNLTVRNDSLCVLHLNGSLYGDLIIVIESTAFAETDLARMVDVAGVASSMGYQNVNLMGQLRDLAYIDGVTGLLNRVGLIAEIDAARDQGLPSQCLVLMDIEGFSELNEALGHHYGDEILKAIAGRLLGEFSSDVHVARVGGDAFVLLGAENEMVPDRLIAIFGRPFLINQHAMYLRMVYGLVRLSEVQGDGADLLKDAYLAVKMAKSQKQNRFAYYDPRVEVENRTRIALLQDLQLAVNQRKLEVYYQPQVDIRSGKVTGMEALLRWERHDNSFTPPAIFIPLAEQSGLIVDIGNWLIEQVFMQKRIWNSQDCPSLRVAINVSVRQFYNPEFVHLLHDAMTRYGVNAQDVEIEITESMAMNSIDEVASLLEQLKTIGFKIALDDFGTGFSSLSYLQRLPIDRIKIDKAFVSTIHEVETQKTLALTIVQMGRSLGMDLIAEGVEKEEQRVVLMELGCPEAQGYLYAKPMSIKDCSAWLLNNSFLPNMY